MKPRLYRWASTALLLPIIFLWGLACLFSHAGEYGGRLFSKLANDLADVSDRWHVLGKEPA